MQDSSQATGPRPASRRGFFFGAATVLPRIVEAPDAAGATPAPRPAPEKGGGYTLSEHVKRYYKTAST